MNLLRMSNSIQIASPLKPLPLKEHRHQQEEAPSSSSPSQHRIVSPKKIEDQEQLALKEERVVDACDGDDDGYHTPTSPRHRIPKAIVCPLAPKRPSLPQRYKKRRACFNVEIKDVQLYFVAEVDEEKRSKKAREEVVSTN